jgi:hypothetical protein
LSEVLRSVVGSVGVVRIDDLGVHDLVAVVTVVGPVGVTGVRGAVAALRGSENT